MQKISVHGPGERIGDDQRRGREEIHLHFGVDPAFEVAVAGKNCCDGQIILHHGSADLGYQGPGVADAGRAAVAHQVEA